jgi:hypothetical protein
MTKETCKKLAEHFKKIGKPDIAKSWEDKLASYDARVKQSVEAEKARLEAEKQKK